MLAVSPLVGFCPVKVTAAWYQVLEIAASNPVVGRVLLKSLSVLPARRSHSMTPLNRRHCQPRVVIPPPLSPATISASMGLNGASTRSMASKVKAPLSGLQKLETSGNVPPLRKCGLVVACKHVPCPGKDATPRWALVG